MSDLRSRGVARGGFSLVELIIAFALIVVGFFTFFSVFSTGAHHAVQTQNRAAANMLAQSYMDEFRAHTFGSPPPAHWAENTDRPVRMVIKDRETEFVFHKKIEFETEAFVDSSKPGDKDRATLTITWKEPAGSNQAAGAPTGFPEDNKMIQVEMPLWR